MKKIIAAILCTVIALSVTGCKKEEDTSTLVAVVTQVEDKAMLVRPIDGSWELKSSDLFSIPIERAEASPEPQTGDTVEIKYNGEILETYPATLGKVFGFFVSKEAESVTISGVRYISTGREVPAEPDESVIVREKTTIDGTDDTAEAYAILEEGKTALCLIDNEWVEFIH